MVRKTKFLTITEITAALGFRKLASANVAAGCLESDHSC